MNKDFFIKKVNFIKEHLSILLLVAPIIGGLLQIFELSKMSISFIRFFSSSQLIADGLMILFLFMMVLISIQIGLFFLKDKDKKLPTQSTLFYLAVGILFAVTFYFYFLPVLKLLNIFVETYNKTHMVPIFIVIFIPIIMFILGILFTILSGLFKNFKKSKLFNYLKEIKILSKIFNEIKPFILMIVFAVVLKYTVISIYILLSGLREAYLMPHNLKNFTVFEKQIQLENNSSQIVYFNDKYIFIESKDNNRTNYKIVKFEDVFKQ